MFKRFFSRKKIKNTDVTPGISTDDANGPSNYIITAIGDIHGRHDALVCLLGKLKHFEESQVKPVQYVFLGDYIDRGPESAQVIDAVINWNKQHRCIFLSGNHEASFLKFLDAPIRNAEWLNFGGIDTALSYGIRTPMGRLSNKQIISLADDLKDAIKRDHLEFLANLQLSYESCDYLFVHAGVYVNQALSENDEKSYLWMREPFLSSNTLFDRIIVHGHTITEDFEPEIRQNRIGIETGSYLNGKITALIIDGGQRSFIFSTENSN